MGAGGKSHGGMWKSHGGGRLKVPWGQVESPVRAGKHFCGGLMENAVDAGGNLMVAGGKSCLGW